MQVCRYAGPDGRSRMGLVVTEETAGAGKQRTVYSVQFDGGWEELLQGEVEPAALEGLAAATPIDPQPAILAPVLPLTEVWGVGLNYFRSRMMRGTGTPAAAFYDLAYAAPRADLFFKAVGARVAGPGEPLRLRPGAGALVAEPQPGLLLNARLQPIGYVLATDLTARDLERENPLYLSLSKVFDGSCGVGGSLAPFRLIEPPLRIRFRVERGEAVVFKDAMTTDKMRRSIDELIDGLRGIGRFPQGVLLLTGSPICPPAGFALAEGDRICVRSKRLGRLDQAVAAPAADA